ncbi:unnamed protein product [Amaranthus hypochondriacus]
MGICLSIFSAHQWPVLMEMATGIIEVGTQRLVSIGRSYWQFSMEYVLFLLKFPVLWGQPFNLYMLGSQPGEGLGSGDVWCFLTREFLQKLYSFSCFAGAKIYTPPINWYKLQLSLIIVHLHTVW